MTILSDLPLPGLQEALSPAQIHLLRERLSALLYRQAIDYTRGHSTSLPRETLNELLTSLCYTLGIGPDSAPEAFLPLLKGEPDVVYAQAYEALLLRVQQARQMIAELCLLAPDLGCIALRDTIVSLREGLGRYDARFFAHRVPGSIDYQLVRSVPEQKLGVDYALEYMRRLRAELRLISRFPLHRCLALLDGTQPDWRELVCNLCAPIAENALGLALLGENPLRLHMRADQRARLLMQFSGASVSKIEASLVDAAVSLAHAIGFTGDTALLLSLAFDLAPRLFCACCAGDLSHVFHAFGMPAQKRT